jgi:hypothetical protein
MISFPPTRFFLPLLGLVLGLVCPPVRAQFTPRETVVGDPAFGCLGLEFSPDMRWLVWTQQGAVKASWLCGVNPDTGDLVPANGRPNGVNGQPFSIPNIPPRGNPQWGRDSSGWFIIAIADDGRLVQVRPGTLGVDGNWLTDPVIAYPAVPVNATRQYPFAARLPDRAASYVIYQQLANGNGAAGIYWVDLGDPNFTEHLVTAPSGYTMPPTLENIAATIYRWFPGLPIFTYAVVKQPGGAVKMAQLDVSAPTPTPVAINPATDNVAFHTDDFPSVNFGRRTLIGGITSTATARYYLQNPVTNQTSTLANITVTPAMSALGNPQFASSFEPFEWNGRVYAPFQIIDGADPLQAVPSEIWLTSLSDALLQTDTSLLRRINTATSLQRRDPEYFLGTTKAWIFYYAKPSGTLFTIYRAETGLPARQTAATLGLKLQGFQGNTAQLLMTGAVTQFGVLQSSEDLTTWTDRTTTLFGTNAVPFSETTTAAFPRRFYRMRTP